MVEVYDLAFKLHMPVYRLLKEMPYEELLGWFEYFKVRPVGWQDDQRTCDVQHGGDQSDQTGDMA